MSKYSWKIPTFAKNVDADKAVAEFHRIETTYGALTPENILEAAKSKRNVLHSLFTWDDTQAANAYRLTQARTILNNIEVVVVADEKPRNIAVYEVVKRDAGNVYKHVTDMTTADVQEVRERTRQDLKRLTHKLSFYNQFHKAIAHLEEAISELDEQG